MANPYPQIHVDVFSALPFESGSFFVQLHVTYQPAHTVHCMQSSKAIQESGTQTSALEYNSVSPLAEDLPSLFSSSAMCKEQAS